jgi:hypothetical protein
LTAALAESAGAAVPPALLGLTLRAALSFAAGGAAMSARALTLAKAAVQTMNVNKLIQATLVCLTVGIIFQPAAGTAPRATSRCRKRLAARSRWRATRGLAGGSEPHRRPSPASSREEPVASDRGRAGGGAEPRAASVARRRRRMAPGTGATGGLIPAWVS